MKHLAILLALGLVPACGYSSGSLAPPSGQRVYLPVFENRTFYRDLEIQLTRDVERELSSRPGFFIVPREQADILLVGTIETLRQQVLSEDRGDQVRESSATTTVHVELRRARGGELIKEFRVRDRAEFFVPAGEDLGTATDESFADLARRIVNGLERDFPHATASPVRAVPSVEKDPPVQKVPGVPSEDAHVLEDPGHAKDRSDA